MFTREQYFKNNKSLNHSGNSKNNIISNNKYHQRTFQKTKKQIHKKNFCNRLSKKQSSYIYWNDKENDQNIQNYNYNKKSHYDFKKKSFRYKKKSKLENNSNFNVEKKNNKKENGENINIKKDEYEDKEEISKDEKNNSFEYTITTEYSNSTSTNEESNNNQINYENLNNEFKLNL